MEWQDAEDVMDSDEDSEDEGGSQSNPMKVNDERSFQRNPHRIHQKLCLCLKSFGLEGLKLVALEETLSFGQSVLKLTFDPGSSEAGLLTAECRLDHPFFVKNKGRFISSRVRYSIRVDARFSLWCLCVRMVLLLSEPHRRAARHSLL